MTESRPGYDPTTAKDHAKVTQRVTRYVYHIHGHARLHSYGQAPGSGTQDAGVVAPFEVVLRRPLPVTSDYDMEDVRGAVRMHIVRELEAQGSPYVVGDVMVRGVSHLHTIIVDDNDPEGPPARVLT